MKTRAFRFERKLEPVSEQPAGRHRTTSDIRCALHHSTLHHAGRGQLANAQRPNELPNAGQAAIRMPVKSVGIETAA